MTPARRLAGTDALMWHIEVDPILRSPIVAIALLERAPRWPRLQEIAMAAVDAFPALRQRVEGRSWVDAPDFEVSDHVRRTRLSRPGPLRSLLDAVEPVATAPFDPARPPWEWTLFEGLEHGRAGLVFRLHHSLTDGVGGIGLAASLLFDPDGGETASRGRAVGDIRASRSPVATLLALPGEAARLCASAARELAPAPGPLSPVMRGRGLRRSLQVLDVPMADLRAASGAIGGSVNDIFLAAVAGAMARYHDALGSPASALRFTMPVSLRSEADPAGGNRFAPARFVMPLTGSAAERAGHAHVLSRQARAEPALALTSLVSTAIDVLTPRVAAAVVGSMFKAVDVDAVDVPGIGGRVRLAGVDVERLYAFAPPTGAALSTTLLSHGSTACIGLQADRAAVLDPPLLRDCLVAALDEVLELGPKATEGCR